MSLLTKIFQEKTVAVLFLAFFWFYAVVFFLLGVLEHSSEVCFFLVLLLFGLSLFVRKIVLQSKRGEVFLMTWTMVFLFYAVTFALMVIPLLGELLTKYPQETARAWRRFADSAANFSF